MINYHVGVDPGAKGGLSILCLDNSKNLKFITAKSMPTLKVDGKATLDTRALETFFPHQPFIATLEQVAAMPHQGVSSTFQFGRMFGAIEAMLDATAEEINYVWAVRWKKHFGIGADKEQAIECADTHFGSREQWHRRGKNGGKMLDHNSGVAEATLLALYGVQTYDN